MNPSELLKVTENLPAVAYHKFVLLCKGREDDLFCFFEGKDSQYYSARIKNNIKRKYHPISCGNKKSVIEVWKLTSKQKEYTKYLKCFFVDKDFDPPIGDPGIYETSCYSVENFYVTEECLSELLKNEFQLTEVDEDFKLAIGLYNREFNAYLNEIMLFNGWYAALKFNKTKNNLRSTNVNLEDKLPKGFINLKIGEIKSEYDLPKIRNSFPDAIKVSNQEVLDAINTLKKSTHSCSFRGKFVFTFFYTFLRYLIEDANNKQTVIKKKTKFNLDKSNMYSQLCQYAVTPDDLLRYLSQFN